MFTSILTAAALWLVARVHPEPPPPTASIPRGESPRNVRPWTPPTHAVPPPAKQ